MPTLHGIDAIQVSRIRAAIERHGERFLDRVFTATEREYAFARKRRDEHLAARFAAKEAVLKALGTGWGGGLGWTDVEVVHLPSGEPAIRLHNAAAMLSENRGVTSWVISITHTEDLAIASVLGVME